MLVYQLEIISACIEITWQHETNLHLTGCISSYCALLFGCLVDMDCNCMRAGFDVHSSQFQINCVIQIFMRKSFMVQHHPQNIFNIELFLNYGITFLQAMLWLFLL